MVQKLLTQGFIQEPHSVRARKSLVRLIARLQQKGFRISYKRGVYYV